MAADPYELAALALASVRSGITAEELKACLSEKPSAKREDHMLTRKEAASKLGVSVRTVDRWIKRRAIKGGKLGPSTDKRAASRISYSSLQRFMASVGSPSRRSCA
jgi:excisionase family DNA binding protein